MKKLSLIFVLVGLITLTSYNQNLIVGDTINSNFHNIPDTTLPFVVKDVSIFDIDIDDDQIYDIRFKKAHSASPAFSQISYNVISLDTVQFVGVVGSPHYEIDTLSIGTEINNSLNWNNSSVLYTNFSSNIPPPWGSGSYIHGICINDSLFIGFRKISHADTLYGWFHLDMSDFTILSYATDPTSSFIEEINTKDRLLVYPNPVETNLFFTPYEKVEMINVYSLVGNKIKSYYTHKTTTSIDIANIAKGAYIFEFIGPKGKVIGLKKIILN